MPQWTVAQVRQTYLDFFAQREHRIVPSAPLVNKDDPTLLFINSGMAPFKDAFLGNKPALAPRVADTQKCLRVSGKHNDLEEVGHDTYHHTLFEMLGNWSFGDYFKVEAIDWAWELLTEVFKLPKERLYVTIFGGDEADGLGEDTEAAKLWEKHVPADRILRCGRKDNFWEMGDQGPCGPCSEIHIDLRPQADIDKKPGHEMVNADHPQVIEIWNLVFMAFERKADGSLVPLKAKHIDTGMGLERLTMALQGALSTYDIDLFQTLFEELEDLCGKRYGKNDRDDVAFRVCADHIRAIAFTIADGQLPSNTGAGYVIRRILRRAVRYGFQTLGLQEPFLHKLIPALVSTMGSAFPELKEQQAFLEKVILEEETSFLRTLEKGIDLVQNEIHFSTGSTFSNILPKITGPKFKLDIDTKGLTGLGKSISSQISSINLSKGWSDFPDKLKSLNFESLSQSKDALDKVSESLKRFAEALKSSEDARNELAEALKKISLSGKTAFDLYDTYGFPIDLTELMAKEAGFTVDMDGFKAQLKEQKLRSKADAVRATSDWTEIAAGEPVFVGYDELEAQAKLLRYRAVTAKGKTQYQLVFDKVPFYPEGGGQVGDRGRIVVNGASIPVRDTKKENQLPYLLTDLLPEATDATFTLQVDPSKRKATESNHSATHLLHAALRKVLGSHVEQRGSLVNENLLRFDFSHFEKVTDQQIIEIEQIVNTKIREDVALGDERAVPIEEAKKRGAMALFGEKYGETVRVVTFDPGYSVELCGGTHVPSTGRIGLLVISSETAVAAGVRRIEALTGAGALKFLQDQRAELDTLSEALKHPASRLQAVETLQKERGEIAKKLEELERQQTGALRESLLAKAEDKGGFKLLIEQISVPSADALKGLCFELRQSLGSCRIAFAVTIDGKPQLAVMLSDDQVAGGLNASNIVREMAKAIQGGGGGQPFFATAGGKDTGGLAKALTVAREKLAQP